MTAKRSVWFRSALWLGGFTFFWTFSVSPADAYLQVKNVIQASPTSSNGIAASTASSQTPTIPIAGFTPQLVVGLTNATNNELEWETVRQPSMIGTPYPSAANPYRTIATLDTGANVSLMSLADRTAWGLADIDRTIELQGAGPDPVYGDIMHAAGFFGYGTQCISGGVPNTASFVGVSNCEAVAARPDDQDLPTVFGMPFAVNYTTVIRANQPYLTGTFNGVSYNTPAIDFYTDRHAAGVPAFEYRLHATFDQPSLLPPTFIPPEFEDLGLPPAPTASAAMCVDANVTDNGRYGGGSFLFDTGAQVTVISTDNALDLGLNLGSPEFTVEITGIGGTQTAPGYTIDQLTLPATGLGNLVLSNVPIIVLDVTGSDGGYIDGIIGMNLFGNRALVIHGGYVPGVIMPTYSDPFIGITALPVTPGDANKDGVVNFTDYLILGQNFGLAGGWTSGDFNSDGIVNFSDYLALSQNFGSGGLGGLDSAYSSVPEPATLSILARGLFGLIRRRK